MSEEKLKKTWVTVDAQSNKKDDVKRETVYCLDDDNETEVQADDTIQGEGGVGVLRSHCLMMLNTKSKLENKSDFFLFTKGFVMEATSFPSQKLIKTR